MRRRAVQSVSWVLGIVVALASLSAAAAPPSLPPSLPSLYDRLGGAAGIGAIADSLIDRTSTDPRTRRSFAKSDLARIKRLLAEQLCDLSGGPCDYSGDSMHDVHAGHGITESELYLMVDFLREILRERDVAIDARNELLALLAPMKRDVVEQ